GDSNRTGIQADGKIGTVRIDGSLRDGAITFNREEQGTLSVGRIFIGGDLAGETGIYNGSIFVGGRIGSFRINGSMIGGDDNFGGSILAKSVGHGFVGGDMIGQGGD